MRLKLLQQYNFGVSRANRFIYSVDEPVTEFYSTGYINEIYLGAGNVNWIIGKCIKLQDEWYKIVFFKNNPVLPFNVAHYQSQHLYKLDNNDWPMIFALAAKSDDTYINPPLVVFNSLVKSIAYTDNESYLICIENGLAGCSLINEHQLHENITNHISDINENCNINIKEWKNMTKNEFVYWYINASLNINNEIITPDFENMEKNTINRIKERQSLFLEELIIKTCHPSRILEIDNTITTNSNKRKRI
jgi:hypothetical protein